MHIGTRIRFYRLLRGLSPEELSDGITALSYLASIENNGHTPPIEMLSQLCDRLEIPFMTYPNEELTQLLEINGSLLYYKMIKRNPLPFLRKFQANFLIVWTSNLF